MNEVYINKTPNTNESEKEQPLDPLVVAENKIDQNLTNELGLSAEEKANLDSVLKTRASLVQQLTLALEESDLDYIIQQIESLRNSVHSENVQYELDYLWEQKDIDIILDAYNERSKPNGGENYSYGLGGFLPWFLGARKRKGGELRDGVSTLVVKWMQDKVSKGEDIDLSFQNTLATWAQNIHMAKMDSVLSLLNRDKINPGILAENLKSEIMASLSFYDNAGYYSNFFKNTALSKNSSFEEVSRAISSLIFFNSHGDNVGYEDSGNYAHTALEEIYEKRSEYFFRILISSALKLPLEDKDPGYKRAVLLREGYDVDEMDDTDVIKAFNGFIENNFAYCRWAERVNYTQKVSKPLGKLYGFGTYQEENSSFEDTLVPYYKQARQKREELENSTFADVTSDYGILYVSDNSFKIFEKDHDYEVSSQKLEEKFGTLEIGQLRYYISMLSRCKNKEDFSGMLPNLYAIGFLPQEKRKELSSSLGDIPDELVLPGFLNFGERKEFINHHQDELIPLVEQLKNGGVDLIIKFLEESKHGLEGVAKKEYFGYKDINPDELDYFLSFFNQSPFNTRPPHHTIYYYAYIRKVLPDDLVREFETEAGIEFPKEIEEIETYDDFLSIKDNVLHSSFAGLLGSEENVNWLHYELIELADEIKTKLPQPKFVSLEHFMKESAVPEEKITEEFLSNYSSLLDIKIRVNVESKIGFCLSSLDVPAQIAFLDFLSRTSEVEINNFSNFLSKYEKADRVAICSCYLAFSKEKDFSYMVERLCDHEGIGLPLARHVSKLIGNAQEIKGFIEKEFKTSYENKNISRVHGELIKRAYDLFLKYNSEVFSLETIEELESGHNLIQDMDDELALEFDFDKDSLNLSRGSSYKETRDLIAKKVEADCDAELFSQTLFINSFKTLHESGTEFLLEDIESSQFEQLAGGTLTPDDISAMRSIYSQNQAEVGAHDEILAHFAERVKDPLTKFYIFKWQGKIQSFVAFSDKGESLFEATSFNVDPSAKGYKIGEAMLEEAIAKEAAEHVLYGECYANLKIAAKYIETGWIAEGHFTEPGKKSNTTDQLLNICRNDKENGQYWGKRTLSPETIYDRESVPEFVKVEEAGSQLGLPLYLLNEGYVLTRMFYHEPKHKFVGVFEPDFRPEQVTEQVKRLAQLETAELDELVGA